MSLPHLLAALAQAEPVFVKHVMPVLAEAPLTGDRAEDLPAILAAAALAGDIPTGVEFSVQCRCVAAGCGYHSRDVEVQVGSFYEERGAVPAFYDPEVPALGSQKVVSVCICAGRAYIGFSSARENLHPDCDERRVCSRDAGKEINRAEFKLKEALRVFGIRWPRGRALDLGAAPGGWSKVLADRGMQVVAVDPGALDERVARLPRVTHVQATLQEAVLDGVFDLLLNDMYLFPDVSARLMVQASPHLAAGALAIMTAKLGGLAHLAATLSEVRAILEPAYDVLRIKSLFHNRREVTLLCRKKA